MHPVAETLVLQLEVVQPGRPSPRSPVSPILPNLHIDPKSSRASLDEDGNMTAQFFNEKTRVEPTNFTEHMIRMPPPELCSKKASLQSNHVI